MILLLNDSEYCTVCKKLILDTCHVCDEEELEEENYSDRLAYGFKLLDMED